MRLTRMFVCSAVGVLVAASPCWSQDGDQDGRREGRQGGERRMQRSQQLSPEQAKAVWTWQAKGLAVEWELDPEKTSTLVEVYLASRKALNEAVREAREADGDGERRRRWRIDPEIVEDYRAALESEVSKFLDDEHVEVVSKTLASFNPQWDRMVHTVVGFDLGEDRTYAVLVPIRTYVARLSNAREVADGDWETMRGMMTETRGALYDDLGDLLAEEQLAELRQATDFRRRQRRQGGQREGEQREGDRANAAGIGEPAPAFMLKDSQGREYTLADYRGRIVVLQWINPDCPVCRRTSESGKVASMREKLDELTGGKYVHLAINSTHYMEPEKGQAYLERNGIDAPVLIDRDGTVGHLYDAKRTPHMYVIDAEGVLRYQGAIDDDEHGSKGKDATNHVVRAVKQMTTGDTVAPDVTRSYGCSVKYAQKQ